jgi:hypothetical protein
MTSVPDEVSLRRAKRQIKVRRKSSHELEARGQKVDERRKLKKKELHERQFKALQLRQSGAQYRDIAGALGYSGPGAAKNAVAAALGRLEIEAAKDVVALDLTRLDEYQMRCTAALRNNGDLGQIDRLMRIMEMRYKLLGVSDETMRQLQADHGIHTTTNIQGGVQVIMPRADAEEEFVRKMMLAVGIDPDSKEATSYRKSRAAQGPDEKLPLPPGSANDSSMIASQVEHLGEEEIVDAELVE